jgi:hypothetical protein
MHKLLSLLIALAAVVGVALTAIAFGSVPANAFGCQGWPQLSGGNGCNSSIATAPSFTTWNPSAVGINITLSNGNLTTTEGSGGGNQAFRSVASHSTGLFYYEAVVSTAGNIGTCELGIGNGSANLNSFTGSDNNSIGAAGSGSVWFNNANPTGSPIQVYSAGNIIAVAVDMTHTKIWWKNLTTGSGWNNDVIGNQNPATNTGGISFSTMGAAPWFAMGSTGAASDVSTVNFGASAYVGTPPSGFGNW